VEAIEPTEPVLEYAPRPGSHRRRRLIRRVACVVVVLALALTAWRWGPDYTRRGQYLYQQSRCMKFEAPADHVAYEEDPQRAAALAKQPGYRAPVSPRNSPATQAVAFYPAPLGRFITSFNSSAFVGARTSPAGHEWLVIVECILSIHDAGGERKLSLHARSLEPATLRRPRVSRFGPASSLTLDLSRLYRLRLFWGQRDPQHADRFTIGYLLNDEPGTIEGRLTDDGKVYLTVRDGPLTARVQGRRRP
jgi:hypothetical protein